jgi:hypothetical protein
VNDITISQPTKKQNIHTYQLIKENALAELIYGTRHAITST